MVTNEWLTRLNEEFRKSGIDQKRRPFEAIKRYSDEFKTSVSLSSDVANNIFEYFEANSKPGIHAVGSMYESIYFYDSVFWSISIPITYGAVEMNALNCLTEMPNQIKDAIMSESKSAWDYMLFWADAVDYGMGVEEVRERPGLDPFGLQLLRAGDQELRSAVAMLRQHRPDARAILPCRMAVEIFLKAFVALKAGLTEKEARDLGHNLQKSFDRFMAISGYTHWEKVKDKLALFPQIHERYSEQEMPLSRVWEGFTMAQSFGTLIIREYTDRNTTEQILRSQKG